MAVLISEVYIAKIEIGEKAAKSNNVESFLSFH